MKKLITLMALVLVLTACSDNEDKASTKEETVAEAPTEQPEVVKEVKTEDKNTEEEPISKKDVEPQQIQDEPGQTQSEKYIIMENENLSYIQTGDAFLVESEINKDSLNLVVPMKFTNKSVDQPIKPYQEFSLATKAIQTGKDVNYDCYMATYSNEEYKEDLGVSVNKGGETDFYLMYQLKDPTLGLSIFEKSKGNLLAEFVR
ncbi:hypothetical protein [uncultured Anaerococcus sp.]|uniref:hypothetical protein n=1 Tax=uncultured Anaerococcus sp. TaxID=293428 RepID=UPI00288A1EB2|nr:hypothetical protein [uncultured Anaerococcus sp.]